MENTLSTSKPYRHPQHLLRLIHKECLHKTYKKCPPPSHLLKPRIHDATRCTTGSTTGCTTRKMFVYTIQPVVQPVVQPAVSCIQTFSCWTNRLYNRLYEFNTFDSCNPTSNRSIVYTDLQPVVQPVGRTM